MYFSFKNLAKASFLGSREINGFLEVQKLIINSPIENNKFYNVGFCLPKELDHPDSKTDVFLFKRMFYAIRLGWMTPFY